MEAKHSDDQLGRARVQDTPELEAYYNELEQLGAGALWTVANDIEPWEPRSSSVPWHADDAIIAPEVSIAFKQKPFFGIPIIFMVHLYV